MRKTARPISILNFATRLCATGFVSAGLCFICCVLIQISRFEGGVNTNLGTEFPPANRNFLAEKAGIFCFSQRNIVETIAFRFCEMP
jgi:hypothetical protein